jgi:plasmid stabilization system protein ParE
MSGSLLPAACRQSRVRPLLRRHQPGLYRREQGKHVIFFRRESGGILVSRILHDRMLLEKHAFTDEDNAQ